jgi:hypothetical protein
VVRKCIKCVFNHSRGEKIIFSGLDSGGQPMHQNTFLTTPEVKKIFFGLDSVGLEVHENTFVTT